MKQWLAHLLRWSLLWIKDFCPARAEEKPAKPLPEAAAKSHAFSEGSKGNPSVKVTGEERNKTKNTGFFNRFEEGTLLKVVPLKKQQRVDFPCKVWEKKEEAQLIKVQLMKFQPVKIPI